ncbi:Cytochrome P450 18a1 [Strongyloides ratti]|uniref:Cytochrome P450 18a1 n=1 Tax=Strongyloides ratti TaxID=34506 RepID=A0A090KW93_STRRB|nr:Cytochrome P450 18a1 [Strongyloides ratti]CEF60136.1 Cytochrome P450 18a1 [Strongyloides ratti]
MPDKFEDYRKQFGPIFTIYLPYPVVVLCDYDSFKEALVKNSMTFSGRAKRYPESFVHPETGRGIVFADGPYWKEQRKVCLQIFRNFGIGRSIMESKIMEYVFETLNYVEDKRKEGPLEFTWIFRACFANVMTELLFGIRRSLDDNQELKFIMEPLEKLFQLGRSNITLFYHFFNDYPWIIKILKKINNVGRDQLDVAFAHIRNVIIESKSTWIKGKEPTNFVHAYMEKTDSSDEYVNEAEMPYVIHDVWVAGMETTATALNWSMNILGSFPDKQEKIRKEIHEVIGYDIDINYDDKNRLPYCLAAVYEILRFSNIIPHNVTHRTENNVTIGGKFIPGNTIIFAQQYNILKYDPIFCDSDNFLPERFLMEDEKTFKKEAIDRMLIFSAGSRKCIGENMAMMQMFLFLTNILSRYIIKVPKNSSMPLLKGKWAGIIKAPPFSFDVIKVTNK